VAEVQPGGGSGPLVTYRILPFNGTPYELTLPADWKVTFGPLFPGAKSSFNGSDKSGTLRFYEGTKQRGIIRDVNSFMDTRITVPDITVPEPQPQAVAVTPTKKSGKQKPMSLLESIKQGEAVLNRLHASPLERALENPNNPDHDPTEVDTGF
jgi:hypothetical protein